MDCLTDTTCMTTILDTLNQLAATIDYYGLVLFGDGWSPIAPVVEVRVETFARIFNDLLFQEPSGCTRYAMLETARA